MSEDDLSYALFFTVNKGIKLQSSIWLCKILCKSPVTVD